MKFTRDTSFDSVFSQVPEIRWYPYIGRDFGRDGKRIMVYAHNIPVPPREYDQLMEKWKAPSYWADTMEEYVYQDGWWTKTFRAFVKAAAGLHQDYISNPPPEIIERVEGFIHRIAYLNFIQDAVKSDKVLTNATWEQAEMSKRINRHLIKALNITHCICWGKPTYQHVRSISGFNPGPDQSEGKRSFSSCMVDAGDGHHFHLLRIHHPSMPRFAPLSKSTQKIIADFLNR